MDVDQPQSATSSRRNRNRGSGRNRGDGTSTPYAESTYGRPSRSGGRGRSNRTAKVLIERLPPDVDESDLQTYFNKINPAPIKVESAGTGACRITFRSMTDATQMVKDYSGASITYHGKKWYLNVYLLKSVDDLDGEDGQGNRNLESRFSVPNKVSGAKPVNGITKSTAKSARGKSKPVSAAAGDKKGQRPRRQKATAEQLDQEMADYFKAPTSAPGDQGMQQ